jgi:PadR family transcriptional regulator PadR
MLPKALVAASLEPIMLSLLAERSRYGYEIIQRVHTLSDGKIKWTASKLYPLLHDLENKGLVASFWLPSESGPDRKYYRLTDKGQRELEKAKQDWLDLNRILVRLWGAELAMG